MHIHTISFVYICTYGGFYLFHTFEIAEQGLLKLLICTAIFLKMVFFFHVLNSPASREGGNEENGVQ
jgi:hypothetical protein